MTVNIAQVDMFGWWYTIKSLHMDAYAQKEGWRINYRWKGWCCSQFITSKAL